MELKHYFQEVGLHYVVVKDKDEQDDLLVSLDIDKYNQKLLNPVKERMNKQK